MKFTTIRGETIRMELLSAIKLYYKEYGFSPSVRELGDMVGLKSTSTVHRNLEVLKAEGKINWNPTMPRTIVLKNKKTFE